MVVIMLLKFSAFVVALILSLAGTLAQATVLDFEDLAAGGDAFIPLGSYSAAGFTITSSGGNNSAFGSVPSGRGTFYAGSASLFTGNLGSFTYLSEKDGAAFNLVSIDLAAMFRSNESSSTTVRFIGNLAGGDTVIQDFVRPSDLSFSTFNFIGFDNLVSVSWAQGLSDVEQHQFDNIVLSTPAVIPEPAPLLLLGLGLAGLAFSRRNWRSIVPAVRAAC